MTMTTVAVAHWPTLGVPTPALPAWRQLAAVLAETPPACAGMAAIFDDPAYVEPAEAICLPCPAITACATYADAAGETGVWGGRDRRPPRPRGRTTTEVSR